MKLLKIIAKGLPLFKETLELSFLAEQRVDDLDRRSLIELKPSLICLNPAVAFAGINASGKTTTLKFLSFVTSYAFRGLQLNSSPYASILGDNSNVDISLFYLDDENTICLLKSTIVSEVNGGLVSRFFKDEQLFAKRLTKVETKSKLTDENTFDLVDSRNEGENKQYLSRDMSIAVARLNKEKPCLAVDFVDIANFNLYLWPSIPCSPILKLLDPAIESLTFENVGTRKIGHLRFEGKDEEIILDESNNIYQYLSSGTIKGLHVFSAAVEILQHGGLLFLDEIENHFNKQIVVSLVGLFSDKRINVGGGVIIFSTHYPELLDIFDRNDGIYILRNEHGIKAKNLSSSLTRNDIKKSDIFESDYLRGTAPSHEAYSNLKSFIESLRQTRESQ